MSADGGLDLRLDLSAIQKRQRRPTADAWSPFAAYGRIVGKYPSACLALTLLFLWPVVGMLWMDIKDNIRDGYTPLDAPSRREVEVLRDFYNTTGEPKMTVVMLTAKDNQSMLRMDHLAEAVGLDKYLMNTFEVRLDDGLPVHYSDLCDPYCNTNRPLEMFYDGMLSEWESVSKGYEASSATLLTYPIAQVGGFKIPVQRLFYGVKTKPLDPKDSSIADPSVRLTNMESVSIIMLLYRGEAADELEERRLTEWEMNVWKYAYEEWNSTLLDIEVIGLKILDYEMMRDGKRLTPFFGFGFAVVGIFVGIAIIFPSALRKSADSSKLWTIAVALGCPMFAIGATFGGMTLMNMRINSFLLIMPTLVLGIGVDDGFLLIHSWVRHQHLNPRLRIGAVLVDVGPSMTITTVTNVLSFGIGCLTPTPEIQLFCFGTMLALAIVYVFHFVLFCPILVLADTGSDKMSEAMNEKVAAAESQIVRRFTNMLGHPCVVICVLTSMVFYWIIFGYGMLQIEPRLDAGKILPIHSRIQRPNALLHDYIWREYQAVNVIVDKPFHIDHEEDRQWLSELVGEFESLPKCLGPEFTMLWFRDYEQYFNREPGLLEILFGEADYESSGEEQKNKTLDGSKLSDFLISPFYKHWKGFLRLSEDGKSITKFWFSVGYTNVTGWGDRIHLVQTWRKIAAKYPQLSVTIWEPSGNAMFVDQMLGLKKVALQTTVLTWTCMAVVCALFIRSLGTVVIASLSIISICIGVVGALSWLGFDLDPVTVAALLMSIGLSVDYTAHTTSHFQRHRQSCRNTLECINKSLDAIAWPMMQSAASTLLCVAPLIFSDAYTTKVFFTAICLVTVLGLLHGIVIVPCIFIFISYIRGEGLFNEKIPLKVEVFDEKKIRDIEEDEDNRDAESTSSANSGVVRLEDSQSLIRRHLSTPSPRNNDSPI